jgi:hypothetical protein
VACSDSADHRAWDVNLEWASFASWEIEMGEVGRLSGRRWFGRTLVTRLDTDRDGTSDCVSRWSWSQPAATHVWPQWEDCDLDHDGSLETRLDYRASTWKLWRYQVDLDGVGPREWVFVARDQKRARDFILDQLESTS